MNRSLLSSLFAPLDEDDDDLVDKKRKIDCEKVSSLGFVSAATAAAEPASMYFVPPLGYRSGVGGDVVNGERSTPAVTQFPMFNSQQGFVRHGTELTPRFPGLNNSWSQQPVGNPYQYCCFPYNNMCVSSAVVPNLKQKVEDSWNLNNPQQMENLFGHIPGSFYQESVLHASFVPFQAMFQNPFFPASVRGPPLNYSPSSLLTKNQELDVCATSRGPRDDYPFVPKPVRGHPLSFSPSASLTKNEELNVSATSQGPRNDNPVDGSASVPLHKRKLGSPEYMNNTTITAAQERNNNANLEPSDRHVIPLWMEHNAAEGTQNVRPSLVSTSAEPQPRYPTAVNSYKLEQEEEIEGKDWVLLVQKELRNTDVGNLGRIVLPKKDAEANLPQLVAKDGLILQMEDVTFSFKWRFKYRYWPNNKSRMYVMENTGDFVRTHNLQTGDFFIVYKEKNSGKYIARGKKGKNSVDTGNDGRPEEGETEAKDQDQVFTQKSFLSTTGNLDVNAENGAFATREPFDFEGKTGGSFQFIKSL